MTTTNAKTFAHCVSLYPQHMRDELGPQRICLMALCHLDSGAVDAQTADQILGLNGGTTAFFNHAGTVPASALVQELARRASCALPEKTLDLDTASRHIDLAFAAASLEKVPPQE